MKEQRVPDLYPLLLLNQQISKSTKAIIKGIKDKSVILKNY